MLGSIIEVVASIAIVIGSIYLLMFMVSMIIPAMKANWKGYLVKALFFMESLNWLSWCPLYFKCLFDFQAD